MGSLQVIGPGFQGGTSAVQDGDVAVGLEKLLLPILGGGSKLGLYGVKVSLLGGHLSIKGVELVLLCGEQGPLGLEGGRELAHVLTLGGGLLLELTNVLLEGSKVGLEGPEHKTGGAGLLAGWVITVGTAWGRHLGREENFH